MKRGSETEINSIATSDTWATIPRNIINLRTCPDKVTNLPTQVNISEDLYFLWNCNNMYTFLILNKDKYLICSLRVTERVKCGHSMSIKTSTMPKD